MEFWKYGLSIKNAIGFLIYYIVIGMIVYSIFMVVIPPISNIVIESIIKILKETIGQIIVFWLILKKIGLKNIDEFEIVGQFNYKVLFSALLIAGGYFFWYHNSIGLWADKIPLGKHWTDYLNTILAEFKKNPYPLLFSAILVAPIFEELFFRGIILKGLLAHYKPNKAILISAILFGIFHMNGPQFVNAFLIGLILGTIYYRTQSLLLSMILHAFNNSIATMIDLEEFSYRYTAFFGGLLLFCIGILFLKHLGYFSSNKLSSYVDPEIAKMKDIDP